MGDFEKFWQEILSSTDETLVKDVSFTSKLSDSAIEIILKGVVLKLGKQWEENYLQKFDIRINQEIVEGNKKQEEDHKELYTVFLSNIGLLAKNGFRERLYYDFWYEAIKDQSNKFKIFDKLCKTLKTRKHMFFSNSFFYFVKYFALSISRSPESRVLMQDRIESICHQMKSTELKNIFYYRMWDLFNDHQTLILVEKESALKKYKVNYHFVSRVFNNDIIGLKILITCHRDLLSMQNISKCFLDYLNNYYQCQVLSLREDAKFHIYDQEHCCVKALRHNFWTTMVENCSEEIIRKVINYYFDQAKLCKSNESNNAFKDILQKTDKSGESLLHKLIKYQKNEVVKHILNLGLFDDCDTASYISYAALYKNYEIIPFIHAKHTESKANVNVARIMSERSQAEAWAKIV